jgi:hypothetical protein
MVRFKYSRLGNTVRIGVDGNMAGSVNKRAFARSRSSAT